jgi:hypothetical protein
MAAISMCGDLAHRSGRNGTTVRDRLSRETYHLIRELDTVVLTRDLPQHGLKQGDVGAVVLVHRGGEAFDVEFVALDGHTIALETLLSSDIRRGENEILHARRTA